MIAPGVDGADAVVDGAARFETDVVENGFAGTAQERFGDSSERMRAGTITSDVSDFGDFVPDPALMKTADQAYQRTRQVLLGGSAAHSTLAQTDLVG